MLAIESDVLLQQLSNLTPEVKAKLQSLLAQDTSIPQTKRQIKEDDNAISSLRRSNADLQSQLFATLSDYKNAEKAAKEQMAGLDASLNALREELAVTLRQKQETEAQKRFVLLILTGRIFVREKMDLIREKSELSAADQEMIIELQFKVSSLTEETGLLQRDKKALTDALKVYILCCSNPARNANPILKRPQSWLTLSMRQHSSPNTGRPNRRNKP
jgi:hypothetical protein